MSVLGEREADSWRHTLALLAANEAALTLPGFFTDEQRIEVTILADEAGLTATWERAGHVDWCLRVTGTPELGVDEDFLAGVRDGRAVARELLAAELATEYVRPADPVGYNEERFLRSPAYRRGVDHGRQLVDRAQLAEMAIAAGGVCPRCGTSGLADHYPSCPYAPAGA
jgi:hypothetical protein